MAKNGRFTLWLLILLLTVAGSASAFDGKREGFCLGFGLGTITYSNEGGSSHKTLTGFQTTLDIGAGITDQLLILYSGHTAIDRADDLTLVWGTPTVIVRYYFKPTEPSAYVFGGPAAAAGIGWDNYETGVGLGGFGFTAGGGYQFSRHFQVELGAVLTSESRISYRAIHVTVNLLGY